MWITTLNLWFAQYLASLRMNKTEIVTHTNSELRNNQKFYESQTLINENIHCILDTHIHQSNQKEKIQKTYKTRPVRPKMPPATSISFPFLNDRRKWNQDVETLLSLYWRFIHGRTRLANTIMNRIKRWFMLVLTCLRKSSSGQGKTHLTKNRKSSFF